MGGIIVCRCVIEMLRFLGGFIIRSSCNHVERKGLPDLLIVAVQRKMDSLAGFEELRRGIVACLQMLVTCICVKSK